MRHFKYSLRHGVQRLPRVAFHTKLIAVSTFTPRQTMQRQYSWPFVVSESLQQATRRVSPPCCLHGEISALRILSTAYSQTDFPFPVC